MSFCIYFLISFIRSELYNLFRIQLEGVKRQSEADEVMWSGRRVGYKIVKGSLQLNNFVTFVWCLGMKSRT